MDPLWPILYPLEPPRKVRPPDRPMQVLCLGLSRSGTDSLRSALIKLGYKGVYHGFIAAIQPEDCRFWTPVLYAKYRGAPAVSLTARDFDTVLGDCQAVTDNPCNILGEELMAAYPDAKVILNRRHDVDAWFKSVQRTIMKTFNIFFFTLARFEPGLFWLEKTYLVAWMDWAYGDFNKHGKKAAVDHYEKMERSLEKQNREYLNWTLEDGWEPLCKFLDKPVPDEPFPKGNAAGAEYEEKVMKSIGVRIKTALIRLTITVTAVGAAVASVIWRWRYR